MSDNPDAEDIPGTLIVRIRESLDFGVWTSKIVHFIQLMIFFQPIPLSSKASSVLRIAFILTPCSALVRLRRFELYGAEPAHPSDTPRRQAARVLVFHMADVETCDASCVSIRTTIVYLSGYLGRCKSSMSSSKLTRYVTIFMLSLIGCFSFADMPRRTVVSPCSSRTCALRFARCLTTLASWRCWVRMRFMIPWDRQWPRSRLDSFSGIKGDNWI